MYIYKVKTGTSSTSLSPEGGKMRRMQTGCKRKGKEKPSIHTLQLQTKKYCQDPQANLPPRSSPKGTKYKAKLIL